MKSKSKSSSVTSSLHRDQNLQSGGVPVSRITYVYPSALEVWRRQRLSWWSWRECQSWLRWATAGSYKNIWTKDLIHTTPIGVFTSFTYPFFFSSCLSVQQHMQQQRVHVPEPTVYPQTLCVWPRHRLQRCLGRVPGVWWVGLWPLIPDSDWGI